MDSDGNPESIQCFAYRSDLETNYNYTAMSLDSRSTDFAKFAMENDTAVSRSADYQDSDAYLMDCPRFANQGCFKAEYTEGDADIPAFVSGFHKGCSMYPLGDISKECTTAGSIGTTCRGEKVKLIKYEDFYSISIVVVFSCISSASTISFLFEGSVRMKIEQMVL